MGKGRFFSVCICASFSKCNAFNLRARDESKSGDAFFSLPTFRGICEELIVAKTSPRIGRSV